MSSVMSGASGRWRGRVRRKTGNTSMRTLDDEERGLLEDEVVVVER